MTMKTMGRNKAAEVRLEVETVRATIGKVHDQLATMQKPRGMKTSALIRNLVALRMYEGPVDLGLTVDLERTLGGLADELDLRVPIPPLAALEDAEGG